MLRWNKPSGRLILLIPAGWSLWLTPTAPPSIELVIKIAAGTLFISGAGCIANDLWDQEIDKQVNRTKDRPLAQGTVSVLAAWCWLILMIFLSLLIVISFPISSRIICLKLSLIAVALILIYPSAKRWFKYPQAILSLCWGFAILIPWASSQSNLAINIPLISCWVATMIWTFGFDTVYAMSDKNDDKNIGLYSSALSLKGKIIKPVSICYASSAVLLANAAYFAGIKLIFWPIWVIASFGMQREIWILSKENTTTAKFGKHFKNQVKLGGLILLGLIIGRL